MNYRDSYKEGVPSVTDLLKWGRVYPDYPSEPTGYYLKRGHWVDQVTAIWAQGLEIDEQTQRVGNMEREKPLTRTQENRAERWIDLASPFRDWLSQHVITYINSQGYIYNPWETYQGTYDLLVEVDGVVTLIDFWCGGAELVKSKALQTTGYAMGMEPEVKDRRYLDGKVRPRRLGVQLESGKLTAHPYTNHRDYDVFRGLARTYNNLKDYR